MMSHRVTVALDDDAFYFLEAQSRKNRSAYINLLLKEARQRQHEQDMITAYQQLNTAEIAAESAEWETATLNDGLEA